MRLKWRHEIIIFMVLYLQLIVKVELIQIDLNIVPINEKKVAQLKMNVLLIISEHVERS